MGEIETGGKAESYSPQCSGETAGPPLQGHSAPGGECRDSGEIDHRAAGKSRRQPRPDGGKELVAAGLQGGGGGGGIALPRGVCVGRPTHSARLPDGG